MTSPPHREPPTTSCCSGRSRCGPPAGPTELTVYDGDLTGVDVPRLDRPVSPTELETWMACPHMYFVRYLLGVYEVEEPGDEINITALDRGSALHAALDRFNQAMLAGDLPQPDAAGWTDRHVAALADIFDTVGADTERAGRTGRPAYWADESQRMRATCWAGSGTTTRWSVTGASAC